MKTFHALSHGADTRPARDLPATMWRRERSRHARPPGLLDAFGRVEYEWVQRCRGARYGVQYRARAGGLRIHEGRL